MALVDVEILSRVALGHPAWDRNGEEIMRAGTSTGRTVTAASASGHQFGSPGRLAALDRGARLGGKTIVATGSGAGVFAVPDRPNFIIAVGSGRLQAL
jgi:hypothetical protein